MALRRKASLGHASDRSAILLESLADLGRRWRHVRYIQSWEEWHRSDSDDL